MYEQLTQAKSYVGTYMQNYRDENIIKIYYRGFMQKNRAPEFLGLNELFF
jgi:hypothetical protein